MPDCFNPVFCLFILRIRAQAPAFQLIERLTLRRCLPGAVAHCDEVWENQVFTCEEVG
jgi:hypothetical protein